jgi:hypothetical protein
VRLSLGPPKPAPFAHFDRLFALRKSEADAFYAELQSKVVDEDLRRIQRQAFAGILWSKQFFYYDVTEWLDGDPAEPKPPAMRHKGRNREWVHATMEDVVSMPDKWEFPWFAGWDWAFHLVTLASLDLEDAKHQLILLGQSWYMHPNGQLPAYEWNFSDVNPPVQAWAALRLYEEERKRDGKGDRRFLERVFTKLLLNFTWWVNRKDPRGLNVFEGGFLGMDNIGVFDRSATLPVDGMQVQSDGTSWMAMYSLNMLRIAIELAQEDDAYQDIATKFFEHFLMIGGAMTNLGGKGLSLVGRCRRLFLRLARHEQWRGNAATCSLPGRPDPGIRRRDHRRDVAEGSAVVHPTARLVFALPSQACGPGVQMEHAGRRGYAPARHRPRLPLVQGDGTRSGQERVPVGLRHTLLVTVPSRASLRFRGRHLSLRGQVCPGRIGQRSVRWKFQLAGPIWMPINYLFIESVNKFAKFYGDDFKVECPVGSGRLLSLKEIADELRNRLINIFRRDRNGRRPVFGNYEKMQTDPHFKDYLLFHEYYDGDTGRGLGASHQTGWSALVANMIAELHE